MPNLTHILLSLPEANKTESYEALGGKIFEFQFDINETEIKQDQYNMIISGEEINKGNIELKGIYTPNANDLPHFILQNSSDVLSTGDFLAICQPDLPTVYADPVPLGDPQPHDAISFKMPENVGEEVEVPLQQGYTVLTTGWVDDPQSSSKVLEVTREVLNDQGKYEDVVVGKFLYDEQNGLRFVLEAAAPHESNNEFVLNAKIWLLDPEGNPVWPDVQITVEADLPNFAGNFELFGGPDIGAYTGAFTGTWPCPSQQEIMDGLQLTFGFELPGYDMQFDIPIDLANPTTVQLDGRDFFTIRFYTNNTFSIEFLSSYDPTVANPFPPFTGPLAIKVTATDDEGNSSSLRTDINLTFAEAGISFPPATPGGGRVAEPYLKPDVPFVDESDIGTASAVVDVPVPEGWMLITSDSQLKSPPVNGKFDLEKDWTAEADGSFTLATDHGYLTLTNNPDGTVQKLTYTLTDGADHSDTPFPIKDPASSDYLETIMEGVKIVLFANPENQGAAPGLGLPTYPYPIQTTVVVPIKDGEPEITVDPMPGALEAGIGAYLNFDAHFGPDGQADDRPYAFTVANHTTGEDATVYLKLGDSQRVTFTNTDPDTGVVSSYQVYVELEADGSLIFRPGAGQTQNMTYGVTVTITDSDGDKAAGSTPTFTVTGFDPEIVIGDDGVFEAYLPNGSEDDPDNPNPDAPELTAETTVEGGWRLDTSVAVEGVNWVVDANDPRVMVLDLSNTADGGIYTYSTDTSELTFTLTAPIGHPLAGGNNTDYINRDFSFFHPDAPGAGLVTKTVKVLVTDDVPAVDLGAPQGTEHYAAEPITGDVTKFMFGADGPANQNPIEVTIVVTDAKAVPPTTYTAKASLQVGTEVPVMDGAVEVGAFLIEQNSGSYTYTFVPKAGTRGEASITLALTDSDGDTTSYTLPEPFTYEIRKPGEGVNIPEVDERGLDGSNFPIENTAVMPEGWKPDPNGQGANWVVDPATGVMTWDNPKGAPGVLTYTPPANPGDSGSLSFKLTGPYDHPSGDNGRDSQLFTLPDLPIIHDAGSTDTIPVSFSIKDDVPTVAVQQNASGTAGDPLEGAFNYDFGADGEASSDPIVLTFTDNKGSQSFTPPAFTIGDPFDVELGGKVVGSFTFESDGSFTFVPAADEKNRTITVKMEAKDSDGDTADASATIKYGTKLDPIIFDSANPFEEAYLPGGTKEGAGFDPANVTKYADVAAGWTPNPATWTDNGDGTWSKIVTPNANSDLDGVFTFDPTNPNGNLSFTLNDTVEHQVQGADDLPYSVELDFVHEYGTKESTSAELTVRDDMPDVTVDKNAAGLSSETLDGKFSYEFGADGEASSDPIVLTFTDNKGSQPFTPPAFTIGDPFDVELGGKVVGSFTFEPDGSFTFVPAADEKNRTITVKMEAKDSDGDTADASATIKYGTKLDPIIFDSANPFEEAYLPGGTKEGAGFDPANVTKYADVAAGWTPNPATWTDNGDGTWSKIVTPNANSDLDGVFTFDPTHPNGNLSFTLSDTVQHQAQGNDDLPFQVVLDFVHEYGTKESTSAELTVRDDMPDVTVDKNAAGLSSETLDGKFSYEFGADGEAGAKAIVLTFDNHTGNPPMVVSNFTYGQGFDVVIDGKVLGEFTFNQDGAFTFTPAVDDNMRIAVTMQAEDNDGDKNDATATITCSADLYPLTFNGAFDEAYLPGGTKEHDPNAELTKSVDITTGWSPDPNSWTDNGDGTWSKVITPDATSDLSGVFTYDPSKPDAELSFKLDKPVKHDAQGRDQSPYIVELDFVHVNGDSKTITAQVDVQDDMPVVTTVQNAAGYYGETLNGEFAYEFGADGPAAASSIALTFTDDQGSTAFTPANFTVGQPFDVVLGGDTVGAFTLNADGAFTFTPAKNENRVITVKLDAQDSDGDHADASATITCGANLDPPIFDAANPFEEAYLPGGTKEGAVFDPANVTKYADVTAGWTPNPATWTDNGDGTWSKIVTPNANSDLDGVFTFDPTNPNGNLSFTLSGTVQHPAQGNDDLSFQVELDFVHVHGKTDSTTATLTVRDDMPSVEWQASQGDTADDVYTIDPSTVSAGIIEAVKGADGLASLLINGENALGGTDSNPRVFNGDAGTLRVWEAAGVIHYTYTAKDPLSLGSKLTDQFRATITDNDGDSRSDDLTMNVNWANTAPDAANDYAVVNEDALSVKGNVLANDWDFDGHALTATAGVYRGAYGTLNLKADGSYTYTVDTSNSSVQSLYANQSSSSTYKLSDSFTYTVSDGYGDNDTATLKLDLTPNQLFTSSGSSNVTGGAGDDVLIGDQGSAKAPTGSVKGHNVVLLVDTSAMLDNKGNMVHVKNALNSLAKQLEEAGEKGYTHVNVSLISVNSGAKLELEIKGLDTAAELNQLYNAISSLKPGPSNTFLNYEIGFMRTHAWFKEQPTYITNEFGGAGAGEKYENSVYFLSAGLLNGHLPHRPYYPVGGAPGLWLRTWEPGTFMSRIEGSMGSAIREDGAIMISSNGGRTWSPTGANIYNGAADGMVLHGDAWGWAVDMYEKYLNSKGVKVNVFEPPNGYTLPHILADFDNTNGVTKLPASGAGAQLDGLIMSQLGPIVTGSNYDPGGPDATQASVLRGGEGFNTMFGDALNADWLLKDTSWNHGSLRAGMSYDIVRAYVAAKNGISTTSPRFNDYMRKFIEENSFKFGETEATRGSNDQLYGSDGGNIMFGQGGNDTITGGAGNDLLVGGKGNDRLTGGTGADIFLFNAGEGNDTITDFSRAQGDIVVKVGGGSFGPITGSYDVQDVHNVVDVKQGHFVNVTDSNNHMLVGAGYSGSKINAGGGLYDNVLEGGNGDDVIYGGRGNNLLSGGNGNDHIFGGPGDDLIQGGAGNDWIHGGAGNDTIEGGTGNDFLVGGTGINTLTGGAGADTFAFTRNSIGGKDTVNDFLYNEGDRLSFSDLLSSGETLENYINSHISHLSLDETARTISFNLSHGGADKAVEIHFQSGDTMFDQTTQQYSLALDATEEVAILTHYLAICAS